MIFMNLSVLYNDVLRDIGVAASLCGLHSEAKTIYQFGMTVDESNPKAIEALAFAELAREENVDFALAEIKRWESKYQARPQLLAWKSLLFYMSGFPYDSTDLIDKLMSLGEIDMAEDLRNVVAYLDSKR